MKDEKPEGELDLRIELLKVLHKEYERLNSQHNDNSQKTNKSEKILDVFNKLGGQIEEIDDNNKQGTKNIVVLNFSSVRLNDETVQDFDTDPVNSEIDKLLQDLKTKRNILHLDTTKSYNNIKKAFLKYTQGVKSSGNKPQAKDLEQKIQKKKNIKNTKNVSRKNFVTNKDNDGQTLDFDKLVAKIKAQQSRINLPKRLIQKFTMLRENLEAQQSQIKINKNLSQKGKKVQYKGL